MSFILDALRKAEHARQMSTGASLAELPIGRRSRGLPWWVFALCALLLVNMAVLALVLLRNRDVPQPVASQAPVQAAVSPAALAPTATPSVTATPTTNTPSARALSDEALPAPQVEYETVPRAELELANAAASVPNGPTLVRPIDQSQPAPSASASEASDLHVDLHVYSENPRDRFVVINMKRYTEGQPLPGGGLIEQITAEGVMVYRNGSRFIVNR